MKSFLALFISAFLFIGCKEKSKELSDEIYSRHLQRKVKLTIISTPPPSDKSELNLLLLNDGQELKNWRVKEIMDSLYEAGAINPLVIVAIHAGDRMQEYGVADKKDYEGRGARAGFYDDFVNNELYPFIKKKSGVRKFRSVVIAGASLGGLSAFDIAWNHPDKIDKAGIFSGSFWWRDKDVSDSTYSDEKNRIMFQKLQDSRKKPKLQLWFYAGAKEENSDRDKDGITDVIDDTKDIIGVLTHKNIPGLKTPVYVEAPDGQHDWIWWSKAFPEFMIWAFAKDK
jgi:enterochelin esterase-like enzyme